MNFNESSPFRFAPFHANAEIYTPLNQLPCFVNCQQYGNVFVKSSVRRASSTRKIKKAIFFFHIALHKQETSCLKIRKGTEKPHEVSYRYCSSIQYF